jgi:hypothetical protein
MAREIERSSSPGRLARAWDLLLAGRPLFALVVAWLTTAGHTMNFREMGIAHGWVSTELYSLHTIFAVFIALSLLACPSLGQRISCRNLAQLGLLALAAASFFNGLVVHAPHVWFLAGRALAGASVGLVIYFAPRLLDSRWENPTTWAAIVLPVTGAGAISAATMIHAPSAWEWGFLVEGAAALLGLAALLSMAEMPERTPPVPQGSPAFLPFLVVASCALVYGLHWGQLHGWLESGDIVVAAALGTLALVLAFLLVRRRIDFLALKEGWIRLLLFFFGGGCQFFHGTSMNIYGGLLLNFSTWQRSWLIWSLPLGGATSLVTVRLVRQHLQIRVGLPGAIAGLLLLAAGMFHSYQQTIDWPYWQIQNVADLNWFQAPQHWELAPGRFVMGLGIGLFMVAMDGLVSPDPEREERIRPFLLVMQFYGSGVGIALLVNAFLIGHPIHYSYAAERSYIQAEEFAERQAVLRDALGQAGAPAPERQAETLLYRMVNYESDNLVFAAIYATFMAVALGLAALCLGLLIWRWLRAHPGPASP